MSEIAIFNSAKLDVDEIFLSFLINCSFASSSKNFEGFPVSSLVKLLKKENISQGEK